MRRLRAAVAAGALVTLGAGAAAAPAAALPVTAGASADSAGAATGSGTLSASLTLTGAVGGLLDGLLGPVVTSALDPLVSALQGSLNGAVGGALGAGGPNAVGAPTQQTTAVSGSFPDETFPTGAGCTAGSPTRPCYAGLDTAVDGAPLASVTAGAVRGFTQQTQPADDPRNPVLGRAQATGVAVSALPGISALPGPLAGAATVDAEASCPNDGHTDPSAAVSATDVSLLGGLVGLNVLDGAVAGLVVDGTPVGSLANLSPTVLPGGVTVRPYGHAVRVDVPLTPEQLLPALDLPAAAVQELLADVTSGSLTLSIVAGPGATVTATSARAWGLGIGVDLSGSLGFDLLGVAGARVLLPTGIGGGDYGNLVDLRLADAGCSTGTAAPAPSTPAVPPADV